MHTLEASVDFEVLELVQVDHLRGKGDYHNSIMNIKCKDGGVRSNLLPPR